MSEYLTNGAQFALKPVPSILKVVAADGRSLLEIHPDGSVVGEIEDAGEAARLFVEHLRHYIVTIVDR